MNEIRGMIDKPHRLTLREAGTVTPRNERHSATVTCGPARLLHDPIELSVGMMIQDGKSKTVHPGDFLQVIGKLLTDRTGEEFTGIIVFALGVFQKDRLLSEIDPILWDSGLIEPAPEINQNLETDSTPFVFFSCGLEFDSDRMNILISQFWFFLGRNLGDNLAAENVSFCELLPDGFFHQEGEKFDLSPGRVMGGACFGSPSEIVLCVIVLQLPRMTDFLGNHPRRQIRPKEHSPLSCSLFFVVALDVGRHPSREILLLGGMYHCFFLGCFCDDLKSLCAFLGILMPELEISFFPSSGVQIAEAEIPEGGTSDFYEVGHLWNSSTWFHITQVAFCGMAWRNSVEGSKNTHLIILPLHHRAIYLSVFQPFAARFHIVSINGGSVIGESVRQCALPLGVGQDHLGNQAIGRPGCSQLAHNTQKQ